MSQLPGIAGEIEQIIGLERTVRLLKARGGTEVLIPKRPDGTMLCRLIGSEATQRLIDEMGHGRITLPCGNMRGRDAARDEAKARARAMMAQGKSNLEIALACDLHVRTVTKYRSEIENENQTAFDL